VRLLLLAMVVPAPLVLLVVSLAVWRARRRWPGLMIVAIWSVATTAGCVAAAWLVSLLQLLPTLLFIFLVMLFSEDSGLVPFEPRPEVALALVILTLGALTWFVAMAVSLLLSGLRGSLLAQLWIFLTLLAGTAWWVLFGALSSGFGRFDLRELLPHLASFGVCELGLLGLLGLMNLPVRERKV
jgi:hypothetical protein